MHGCGTDKLAPTPILVRSLFARELYIVALSQYILQCFAYWEFGSFLVNSCVLLELHNFLHHSYLYSKVVSDRLLCSDQSQVFSNGCIMHMSSVPLVDVPCYLCLYLLCCEHTDHWIIYTTLNHSYTTQWHCRPLQWTGQAGLKDAWSIIMPTSLPHCRSTLLSVNSVDSLLEQITADIHYI